MSVDMQEARRIVEAGYGPEWTGLGTFYVSPEAWTDGRYWRFEVGAREWIVGNDQDFMILDDVVAIVDRRTGEMQLVNAMTLFDREWRPAKT